MTHTLVCNLYMLAIIAMKVGINTENDLYNKFAVCTDPKKGRRQVKQKRKHRDGVKKGRGTRLGLVHVVIVMNLQSTATYPKLSQQTFRLYDNIWDMCLMIVN